MILATLNNSFQYIVKVTDLIYLIIFELIYYFN